MDHATSSTEEKDIFLKQDHQYCFPYHHIPHFLEDGSATRIRDLNWGFDYLSCVYHVKKWVESHHPHSVLEVGCGDGAVIGSLSNTIHNRVGVDLSKKAIAFARAFFPEVEFHAKDAKHLPSTFDAVLAIEVLEHIPDHDVTDFLKTLEEKTNHGGLIYISVPSTNLPLYPKHYRHYTPTLLEQQIKEAHLNLETLELRFFRSPAPFENLYKRLTNNRLWTGELHPLRRVIWRNIVKNLERAHPKTAEHVIGIFKKK